jgi:hypothetical protein
MKKCLACNTPFAAETWSCPACRWEVSTRGSIPQFAPEVAESNDGFSPESFDKLHESEAGNFWFRARNKIILSFINKYFSSARSFMEVGCGTGFVLAAIQRRFPDLSCTGTEILHRVLPTRPNASATARSCARWTDNAFPLPTSSM